MLQVTLPEELEQWAVENAAQEGFGTPEAFVVAAVRDVRARQERARAREAALLIEALNRARPSKPTTRGGTNCAKRLWRGSRRARKMESREGTFSLLPAAREDLLKSVRF